VCSSDLQSFALPEHSFEPAAGEYLYFEAGSAGRFCVRGKLLATLGRLDPAISREYKLRHIPWLAELELDLLLNFALRSPHFVPYSKFPVVERDLSLVVPEGVNYQELEKTVLHNGRTMVERLRPIDIFRGGSIPGGHYSLLLRITFHSLSHTLTSEEVDQASKGILMSLERKGIYLRH